MKKLILSLAAALLALTFAACAAEEIPALKGGHQDNADSPLDGEVNTVEAEVTVSDPELPQSDGEWVDWECIAERPYNENETLTADPENTAPADLNASAPTMSLETVNHETDQHEFLVENNTQYEWGYGLEPHFEKYDEEQDLWLPVEPITDITYIEIYCLLQPGGTTTYTLPIEQYYGKLPTGMYRAGLLMRNQTTEATEMVWGEFGVAIIECY